MKTIVYTNHNRDSCYLESHGVIIEDGEATNDFKFIGYYDRDYGYAVNCEDQKQKIKRYFPDFKILCIDECVGDLIKLDCSH